MKRRYLNLFFAFLCFLGCNSSSTSSKDISYYLPNRYKGVVVIVFEGKEKTTSNEFKIPENGILYSSHARNTGVFIPKYFYVDKNGNKIHKIESYAIAKYHNQLKENTPYILDAYDGKFYIKPKNDTISNKNYTNNKNWKTINWIYFTVGNDESQSNDLRKEANRIIDSLGHQMDNL